MTSGARVAEIQREDRAVRVVDLTGRHPDREGRLAAEVTFGEPPVHARLTLHTGTESVTKEAPDLFEALQELRREIHPWCPAVQGARRGVWASPMARDTGAFRVNDITVDRFAPVNLLDAAPRDQLSTVDEQKSVFDEYRWEMTKGARRLSHRPRDREERGRHQDRGERGRGNPQ